jgi:hypothetical protein
MSKKTDVESMLDLGLTIVEIATALRIPQNTVRRIVWENRWQDRTASHRRRGTRQVTLPTVTLGERK